LLCPEHAESITKAGWTKKDVQTFLFDHSRIPYDKLKHLRRSIAPSKLIDSSEGPMVPMFLTPDQIKIIVVGGPGKHSSYINSGHTRRILTKEIILPKNWDRLTAIHREGGSP